MAKIRPFRALRPVADKAKQISCVPYDVVDEAEVRRYIADNPLSFLRVTRPEADLPEGADSTELEVFARARKNLDDLIKSGIFSVDDEPAVYVYQLTTPSHTQTGVVACCSIDEYEQGLIKKHENVRPDKVEERTEHLLAVGAQTGLIFLTFRNTDDIADLIEDAIEAEPIYSLDCPTGVLQRIWRITDTEDWIEAFREVPALYIADGHHRAESARRARETMRVGNEEHTGKEDYNFVVAGMFPAEDLRILPYNRVVRDLNGLDKEDFLSRVRESFIVADTVEKTPRSHGVICMYLDGEWYKLKFNRDLRRDTNPIEELDVSILQDHLLEPVLGIHDPRTDERLGFVGGANGIDELERLVDEGKMRVAFSLYATTMDDLLTVSDMGEIMPPKSTWFEPKLKDGLLVHLI